MRVDTVEMDPQRLDRLRARIREADLAAAVLVHPPNLRYLVGFHSNAYSRPLALVVPAEGDPTLLVPRLEELQAREMTRVTDVRSYVEWDEGSETGGRLDAEWLALLVRALVERGLDSARLGLEEAVLAGGAERRLATALPKVAWSDASGWVERLRLVKSPDEVEHHRRAGQLAAAGLTAGFAVARAGGSELEIKGASIAAVFAEGARRCPTLAVAGAGNALVGSRIAAVHAPATGRRAQPGDPVFSCCRRRWKARTASCRARSSWARRPRKRSAAGSGPWRARTRPRGAGRCQAAGPATSIGRPAARCERTGSPSTCRCGRATG